MSSPSRFSVVATALSSEPREAVTQSRLAGFGGMVFDPVAGGVDLTQLSQTGRREFRHLLSSNVQTLVAIQCDLGTKGLSADADLDRVLSRLNEILRTARDLQSGCVTIDLGPLKAANAAAVLALAAIAERYQIHVALSSSLSDFASLHQAMRNANCPWFGIDLDPVSMLPDLWSTDEIFSQLGDSILRFRAKDALLGDDRRTQPVPIGRGSVKWPELLGALQHAGYASWMTADPAGLSDRRSVALATLDYLRSL